MTRIPALALTLLLALTLGPAPSASAATVRLDGVTVALQPGTTQVITVNRTAVLARPGDASGARPPRAGRRCCGRATAGSGTAAWWSARSASRAPAPPRSAPTGCSAPSARTRAPRGWDLPYRQIRPGDYWVEDNQSAYYNRYRNKAQGGFRWWLTSGQNTSERLADFPTQYEYAVNTGFNREPGAPPRRRHLPARQRPRRDRRLRLGAALRSCATAMVRLDPARVPVIAIGR